jgi:hypothetical protein
MIPDISGEDLLLKMLVWYYIVNTCIYNYCKENDTEGILLFADFQLQQEQQPKKKFNSV